jgi:hypothetical protein
MVWAPPTNRLWFRCPLVKSSQSKRASLKQRPMVEPAPINSLVETLVLAKPALGEPIATRLTCIIGHSLRARRQCMGGIRSCRSDRGSDPPQQQAAELHGGENEARVHRLKTRRLARGIGVRRHEVVGTANPDAWPA